MLSKNFKGRVLLIYPNAEGLGGIPNGLALLSGCLKKAEFDTLCFDTTFLNSPPKTYFQRSKHAFYDDADYLPYWGGWSEDLPAKIPGMLIKCIEDYKPDLIALTVVDASFKFTESLLEIIKGNFGIPIIVGGITCTSSPETIMESKYVDYVCVGEGEEALVEFADAVVRKMDVSKIRNIWVKKSKGEIIKNHLRPLANLDTLPFQDWSIFDKRHHYKPYCGKFYKTLFVEMSRGCPFNCTYCVNSRLREIYKSLGSFIRNRSIDKTIDEIVALKKLWGIELLFFVDDNFLGMQRERFEYFCGEYKEKVDLPFYIQTRSETVKEDYIRMLSEIKISTIAIGVEHGDEGYRAQYLNRKMSNESIIRAFDIVHKYNIRTTANIIIGMPGEKEEMMKETINLLKRAKPKSVSVNFFTPYRGTVMRKMAVNEGIIDGDHVITDTNVCYGTPLFSAERINYYYENLKKYLDGTLTLDFI